VGLLALYRDLVNQGAGDRAEPGQPGFYLGCAVSPFSASRRKSFRSTSAGAQGPRGCGLRDPPARLRRAGLGRAAARDAPRGPPRAGARQRLRALRTLARLFNANQVPGCVVSDDLLAIAEARQRRRTRAGRSSSSSRRAIVAIARGLGFRGVYLAGHLPAADVATGAGHGRRLRARRLAGLRARDQLRADGELPPFRSGPATGLATDEPDPAYAPDPGAAYARSGAPPRLGLVQGEPARPPRGLRTGVARVPGGRARLMGASSACTWVARSTFWSRRSRCRSTTAGTAATARSPMSRTSARSRSAR